MFPTSTPHCSTEELVKFFKGVVMAVCVAIMCTFVLSCMHSFITVTGQPTSEWRSTCDDRILEALHSIKSVTSGIKSDTSQLPELKEGQIYRLCGNTGCAMTKGIFTEFETFSYFLGLDAATWFEARQKCHARGYHPARVESQREQDFIQRWFDEALQGELGKDEFGARQIWMDGTDHHEEGCWIWTDPAIELFSLGYTYWAPGEPNNDLRGPEHCVTLHGPSDWHWNDYICSRRLIYLCKSSEDHTGPLPDLGNISTTLC